MTTRGRSRRRRYARRCGGAPGAIEIGDRAAAIAAGLERLRAGDVLVVAGKGHEQGQVIGERTVAFDDAGVIRALVGG